MARIQQLSQHEAQKIAAGEVVERPSNIVKELVENSIDAGATRISIYCEDGGKELIRVVDNGCGMDATDARVCFDRHATSKITHVDQLSTLTSFGFRGEALASIASVSHITLITKEAALIEGTCVTLSAHTITDVTAIGCNSGTDISVKDLFFNVPARKKFLKTTATEWRAIQLLFNAFCFDYPHIHFSLFTENKQVYNCPAVQSVMDRAVQIWEKPTHNHIIPLIADNETPYGITGAISNHQHYRFDRSSIYFFVNNRWIKNQALSSALIKGYANVLPDGRYPIAAIHITVPTEEVDINIHPRKEEVKFLHPRIIEQALQKLVKKTLEQSISDHIKHKAPETNSHRTNQLFDMPNAEPFVQSSSPHFKPFNFDAFFTNTQSADTTPLSSPSREHAQSSLSFNDDTPSVSIAHYNPTPELSSTIDIKNSILNQIPVVEQAENYRLIGQYKKTYLLIEKEDGLFLVDQHAAHERILYELFSQKFESIPTINLIFPDIITLSEDDIIVLIPHLDILKKNGIIIEQFGSNQLIIQALPVHLKEQSLADIIKEMIGWIVESRAIELDALKQVVNNKLQAQMACKAAVKAGDTLTTETMQQLLTDLNKTANRFACPHGRPTGWLLSLHEIEKKFRRKT